MTPEMQKLIDSGLKQMTELGGEFAIEDPIKTVVLKYTTQVVSGLLHEILLELRYSTGSKLVSLRLLDQKWKGIIHRLKRACVYDATSSNIIPSTCSTAEECQTLLDTHGKCWTRPV